MAITDVLQKATQFVARCYGCATSESLSSARYEVWLSKTSKWKTTGAPKLKFLPSTSEAFEQNVRRAHYQVCIWNAALEKDPPDLPQTDFGWEKDEATKSLLLVTVVEGVALAPPDVLKLTRCGCATDQPCANARCTCATAQLSCTIFCEFRGIKECCNKWTKAVSTAEEDTDSDMDNNTLSDD